MRDLSLHILDVAENSVRAGATRVEIRLEEDPKRDLMRLEIIDNGSGMDEPMRQAVLSPFTTSRTERRVGLGLPLLAQAAREAQGDCEIESAPGQGTRVAATFRPGHIDCKPLGDLGETAVALAIGHPTVDFQFGIQRGAQMRRISTRDVRETHGNAQECSPEMMRDLRERLAEILAADPKMAEGAAPPRGEKEPNDACCRAD